MAELPFDVAVGIELSASAGPATVAAIAVHRRTASPTRHVANTIG